MCVKATKNVVRLCHLKILLTLRLSFPAVRRTVRSSISTSHRGLLQRGGFEALTGINSGNVLEPKRYQTSRHIVPTILLQLHCAVSFCFLEPYHTTIATSERKDTNRLKRKIKLIEKRKKNQTNYSRITTLVITKSFGHLLQTKKAMKN